MWRNRDQFITGLAEIVEFLYKKWERELDYALRKELWSFRENRIAVRFQYECHDRNEQCWRSYGNELWEFTDDGLMRRCETSINDVPIAQSDRRIHGPRPEGERERQLPSSEGGGLESGSLATWFAVSTARKGCRARAIERSDGLWMLALLRASMPRRTASRQPCCPVSRPVASAIARTCARIRALARSRPWPTAWSSVGAIPTES